MTIRLTTYDNKVVFGNFNLDISQPVMLPFMYNENFINLVKGNTCFKGKDSYIDLILTKEGILSNIPLPLKQV